MIKIIARILNKVWAKPYQIHQTELGDVESNPYSEMIANDLQEKYKNKMFGVSIDYINFEALIGSLQASNHPGIQEEVTKPYKVEDFDDIQPEIAELIVDYMNTHLKLMVNAVLQEYLKQEKIKMSVDEDGTKYYTEEEDENIDAFIRLERDFRSV